MHQANNMKHTKLKSTNQAMSYSSTCVRDSSAENRSKFNIRGGGVGCLRKKKDALKKHLNNNFFVFEINEKNSMKNNLQ